MKFKRPHAHDNMLNNSCAPIRRVGLRYFGPVSQTRDTTHEPDMRKTCARTSAARAFTKAAASSKRGVHGNNTSPLAPGRSVHAVVDHVLVNLLPAEDINHQGISPQAAGVRVLNEGWHPQSPADSQH